MDLYKKDAPCMSYTNEEVKEHFIEPLRKHPSFDLRVRTEHDVELSDPFDERDGRIILVNFDGETRNFTIYLNGYRTSIYISDEDKTAPQPRFSSREEFVPNWTFNEEFMFVDDEVRQSYCSCETDGNVVYEGSLRSKTHEEQLALLREFIVLLGGAKSIRIEEEFVSQEGTQYTKYNYTVHIRKDSAPPQRAEYDNILLLINCEEDQRS